VEDVHVMVRDATTASEAVYVCEEAGCGRRLVINWHRPALTVIDRGDFFARHVGMPEGLSMRVAVRHP
jgi:hypothetical protein